jgi:hypothetical protein
MMGIVLGGIYFLPDAILLKPRCWVKHETRLKITNQSAIIRGMSSPSVESMSLVKQALEALQRGDMSAAATHTQQALQSACILKCQEPPFVPEPIKYDLAGTI